MTLNIIPTTMRARHHESGEWIKLELDTEAFWWSMMPEECFYIETGDEPIWADLNDFDSFEATP